MGWSGGGVVTPLYVWNTDKLTYPNVTATRFDALNTDLCAAIQNCLAKDGQNAATANINLGGFKVTNLASGSASGDAATYGQIVNIGTVPRNYLLNSSFHIWQRGTGLTPVAAGAYVADRWFAIRDGVDAAWAVRQQVSAGLGMTTRHSCQVQRDVGTSSVAPMKVGQSIDTKDVQDLLAAALKAHGGSTVGRYLFFACQLTRGVNAAGTVTLELLGHTSAYQNVGTSGGWTVIATYSASVATLSTSTAVSRYTGILGTSLATNYLSMAVRVTYTPTGTAGADDSLSFGQCRLYFTDTLPTTPVGFDPDPSEIIRLFQYYQRSNWSSLENAAPAHGQASGTYPCVGVSGGVYAGIQFFNPMRTAPTVAYYYGARAAGGSTCNLYIGGSWSNGGGGWSGTATGGGVFAVSTFPGTTVGAGYLTDMNWTADAEF